MMDKRDTHQLLSALHDRLVADALERIESGDYTQADAKHALDLVKNSQISAVPTHGNALGRLAGKLDFSAMDDKVVPLRKFKDGPQPEAG